MAKGGHLQGKAVYLASYFFGPGSNRPLDMIVANVSYYYHRNLEGSITTLTDASGAVQASYHYDAYGNLVQSADNVGNPYRWDALEWDATTGLIHDGPRFYDPVTGRHLTPDSTMGDPYGFSSVEAARAFLHPGWSTPAPWTSASMRAVTGPVSEAVGALGDGPTCPPGNGQGNAYGHCEGGLTVTPRWQTLECYMSDTLFLVGVVMTMIGLYSESARLLQLAGAMGGLSMAVDIGSIMGGWQSDILGTLGALIDFAWIFITQIYIPSLSIWDAAFAGIQILPRITPPGFAASLAIAAVTNTLAFAGLLAMGCVPPV